MKLKVIYKNANGQVESHTLNAAPVDQDATLILCRRIAMEGFYKDEADIGRYIAPSQICEVLLIKREDNIVPGAGMSNE